MTDRWHLTPESGAVKGNNPFQLNRTVVDPSFRTPTTSYNVSDINGYSATGEIIFKGRPVSLAPPRDSHCLDPFKRPAVGQIAAANAKNNVAVYNEQAQPNNICVKAKAQAPAQRGGASKASKASKADQLTQALGSKARSGQSIPDWQSVFTESSTRNRSALTTFTENRYAKILGEKWT